MSPGYGGSARQGSVARSTPWPSLPSPEFPQVGNSRSPSLGIGLEEPFLPILHLVAFEHSPARNGLLADFREFRPGERLKRLRGSDVVFHLSLRTCPAHSAMDGEVQDVPQALAPADGSQLNAPA